MKKVFLFTLVFGITLVLWNPALAKKELGSLPAPTELEVSVDVAGGVVCFSWKWEGEEVADKYSVDVDVDVDIDNDGDADMVVEFSFGTGDRTDDGAPDDPNLCVPLTDFVADLNGDDILDPVFGPASAKVKALNPGKGRRQNHPFSSNDSDFILHKLELPI